LNLKNPGRPAIRISRPFAAPYQAFFARHSTAGLRLQAPDRFLDAGPAFRRGAPSAGSAPIKARTVPKLSYWD